MSLDKFRKIEQNKGQFLPDNELEIFERSPIRTSFGRWKNDTLRIIIYDASNTPVEQKGFGFVRYINQKDFPQYYTKIEGETKKSTRRYTIDIKKLVKDAGYNIGIFTIEVMFINSRLGSEKKPNRVWIQEISPSRTEIRLLPYDLSESNFVIEGIPISKIIKDRYDAFLNDTEFKEDIWESVDAFLEKITIQNIKEAFQNRVRTQLYIKILKEYFNRSEQRFDTIMYQTLVDFKKAVWAELENRDSVIGTGYNKRNPNFDKEKMDFNEEGASIDFVTFCLDKLYESLDVNVPEFRYFRETEVIDDSLTRAVTDVLPEVQIPEPREPGSRPPRPGDETTTTTTTRAPSGPDSEEPDPNWTFDRGQGQVTISFWTNLPRSYSISGDEIISDDDFVDRRKDYRGVGYSSNIPPILTLKEFDPTGHPKYWGFEDPNYLHNRELGLVVPNDLNWKPKTPPNKNVRKRDLTVEEQKQYEDFYFDVNEHTIKYTGKWSDAEAITIAERSVTEPAVPGSGSDDSTFIEGFPACLKNYLGQKIKNQKPNMDYPLPAYYVKANNGPEKNIKVFKNNNIQFHIETGGIPLETQIRYEWDSYPATKEQGAPFHSPRYNFSTFEEYLNAVYNAKNFFFFLGYPNGIPIYPTNRKFEFYDQPWKHPGLGIGYHVSGYGGTMNEQEIWAFDGIYDWDTGQSLSNLYSAALPNNVYTLKNVKESMNIFIKYKRVQVTLVGLTYRGNYGADENNALTYCHDPESNKPIGAMGWTQRNFPKELLDEYGSLWTISNGSASNITGEFKKFVYPEYPAFWQMRKKWWDLASITNPLNGGLYKQPVSNQVRSFFQNVDTFDRFE